MKPCKSIGCSYPVTLENDFCTHCLRKQIVFAAKNSAIDTDNKVPEYTGKSVSYYKTKIQDPMSGDDPYTAECGDVIEALGMDFNEGNAFKAIWRKCAARTLGLKKKGYDDGVYDAEKVIYHGERMLVVAQRKQRDTQDPLVDD